MIIFFDKETGRITGTIGGRIHGKAELNMFIGNRETTDKIVCNWVANSDKLYEPEIQKDIFTLLDADISQVKNYKVDTTCRMLTALKI